MSNDTQVPPTTDNAAQNTPRPEEVKQEKSLSLAEKKITSKLRDNVDERGNFKFKLQDYSLGLAAGRNITEAEAKEQIKDMFAQEMGMGIQSYLENDRIAKGLEVSRDS